MLCLKTTFEYLLLLSALVLASDSFAQTADNHRFFGNLNLIGYSNIGHDDTSHKNASDKTWLNGGLGRYGFGSTSDNVAALAEANFAYQYRASDQLRLHAHLQVQQSSDHHSARDIGLVELEARYRYDMDFNQRLTFNAGQFFLPISMENTNRFWESPYTISFSSLNSWIGEEFRPIGIDSTYEYNFDSGKQLSVAATIFGGNDSMGALLAYRGWSHGRQRTALGDTLSLPELAILDDTGAFGDQMDSGTKPFGRDLDKRPGYVVRTSFSGARYLVNLTWVDNQGDTKLHHGEYAWRTKFAILGASWFIGDQLELLGEASSGSSTMGAGPGVDIDFYSAYIMASYLSENLRYSLRYDQFGIDDKDPTDEDSHDLGRSTTFAVMWAPETSKLHGGAEIHYLNSKRAKALSNGSLHQDQESINISLLAKYTF